MSVRTITSSEIDNDDVAARLAQLQSPADDAGLVAAGVALCCAVEQAGGDRMDIEIGCAGSGAELTGGWRVTVMRADDAVAAEELCQKTREMLLQLCEVDSVRDDVPAMLDHLRDRLENDIELSSYEGGLIRAQKNALEFLLETEPTRDADEAVGVGDQVLADFMKSANG